MNIWESFGISVFSSFVVLLAIVVFKVLWHYWLCNAWLKLTCRHTIDISGKWNSKTEATEESRWEEEIELKQYGWKVVGKITHTYSSTGEGSIKKCFEFEGIFREGILSCFFWNSNNKQKGIGSFVLNLEQDANVLSGKHSYYDTGSSMIGCVDYKWDRNENHL